MNTSVRTTGSEQLVALFFCFFAGAVSAQAPAATELVPIPAGPFTMGSDSGPDDERPAHRVDAAAFSIDRTPVTNTQAAEFLNAKGPTGRRARTGSNGTTPTRESAGRAIDGFPTPATRITRSWSSRGSARARILHMGRQAAAHGSGVGEGGAGNRRPSVSLGKRAARSQACSAQRRMGRHRARRAALSRSEHLRRPRPFGERVGMGQQPLPAVSVQCQDGREDPVSGEERVTRGGGQDSSAGQLTTTYRGRGLSRGPRGGHHNIGFRCAR